MSVDFIVPLALGLVALILALPIIALVRANAVARRGERSEEIWQKLTQRVHALETQLQEMQGRLKAQTIVLEQAHLDLRKITTVREVPTPGAVVPPEPPKPLVEAVGTKAPPLEPLAVTLAPSAPPLAAPPPPAETAKPAAPSGLMAPSVLLPIENPPALAPPIVPPRLEMLGAQKPQPHETAKRVLNMEEALGTDWLNKLGMSILVIGVALFLAYEMRELGPAGKVLVGYVVSGAFLGAGIFYERRERYRLLARVAIGGGWALTFFTTYAMYHVAPARVLNSQALDLVLLLAVAAAMVVHTLRYNSQVVTGLALLLGFTTVTISKDNVYSLSAGAILALALVIIVQQRRWFELEV